jgi:hypothetical protein
MLITVSEQCDQKIMAIRDEEKQGLCTYESNSLKLR